ncbi:MAG: type I methionyl aminopeptidase [Candidatus Paceibacterota bacterium]
MITKKTPEEIATLREGGRILARILEEVAAYAKPGMSTKDLDDKATELAEQYGVEPALLGYHPSFAPAPYPAATCISVNDVVQHGVPSEKEVLEQGDVVNIDMTIGYKRLIVDSGITVGIGPIDKESQKLINVTREALMVGIAEAKPGNHIGDISNAIQRYVESHGLSIVDALCGHGVGYKVHEEPQIPNFGKKGRGPLIEVGHVYAIEPIVNVGGREVVFDDEGDGYSVFTADGSRSAHFEHTVAITEDGAFILTEV